MVVKRTYLKVIYREIKGSLGRFAAIFGIVALGVGFLSGLLVTTPDMNNSVDIYYDENNMADIFIKATMGLTEEDFELLNQDGSIEDIMPAYVTDVLLDSESSEVLTARIYGLPIFNNKASINKLVLLDGRLPEKPGEALAERGGSFLAEFKLGDKLTLSAENEEFEDLMENYSQKEFTIVGIVGNTFHFSKERETTNIGNGRLNTIIYVDESSYEMDVYTDFYITLKGFKDMDSFSDEYEIRAERIVDRLEILGEERSVIRYKEIYNDARSELDDGWKDYEEGRLEAEIELADALKELKDGEIELEDGRRELLDGQKDLAEAKVTLRTETEDAKKEIADGRIELADALIELQDGEKELKDAKFELEDGEREYYEGYLEFLDGEKELKEGQEEFDKGEQKYLDGVRELAAGKRELRRGEEELEAARQKLLAGGAQLESGKKELAENRDALITAKAGREQLEAEEDKIESSILQIEQGIEALEIQLSQATTDEEKIYIQSEIDKLDGQLFEAKEGLQYVQNQLSQIPSYAEIEGGLQQIEQVEAQLPAQEAELAAGWEQYYAGLEKIKAGWEELNEGEETLKDAKREIERNRIKLEDAWEELEEGRIELQDGRKELDDGWKEYNDGVIELQDGWKEYNDGLVELADAEKILEEEIAKANKEIRDAEIEIADGWVEYNDGVIELEDGWKEYEEGKLEAEQELADGLNELLDGEKELRELGQPEWYVLDRNSNTSYVSFQMNAEKVAAISKVFPVFFYLVAALVALTTMTRMVEEERTQIGTLKALGYNKGLIMLKYLVYCGLASVLGSTAGLAVGFKLLPAMIYNAYGVMFHLPELVSDYNFTIASVSSGLAILSTVGATVYAVNEALKEKPATLMLPRAPKAGKRILLERVDFIWSRMSFNHKATARNLFRYKKHFFMTVIGIAGCTGLLVTGFGMRDSINMLAGSQFTDLFKYELELQLEEEDNISKELQSLLNDKSLITGAIGVLSDKGLIYFGDENIEATLIAPESPEDLNDFIGFRDRLSGEPVIFGRGSAVITEKLSEELGIKIGDTIIFENSDDKKGEVLVTGITENYLGNYLYLDREVYEEVFNKTEDNNLVLAKTAFNTEQEKDELAEKLLSTEGVMNTQFISQTKSAFDKLLRNIEYIIVVIIAASGMLAFIVLYNLTNININERKKELATLKVLGFYSEEVNMYIFREIGILTMIGILVGLFLGKLLHVFIIKTIENPDMMFGREIFWQSYLMAAAITIVFSLLVNLVMTRKLRGIKMVDSMKALD